MSNKTCTFQTLYFPLHCEISDIKWTWKKLKGHQKSYTARSLIQYELLRNKHIENISRLSDVGELFRTFLLCEISDVRVWSDHWAFSSHVIQNSPQGLSRVSEVECTDLCFLSLTGVFFHLLHVRLSFAMKSLYAFLWCCFLFSYLTMEVVKVKLSLGLLHTWELPPLGCQRSPAGM